MEFQSGSFDCAIIGGGLAGLCLAIQLVEKDISVVLFEKISTLFIKFAANIFQWKAGIFLADWVYH